MKLLFLTLITIVTTITISQASDTTQSTPATLAELDGVYSLQESKINEAIVNLESLATRLYKLGIDFHLVNLDNKHYVFQIGTDVVFGTFGNDAPKAYEVRDASYEVKRDKNSGKVSRVIIKTKNTIEKKPKVVAIIDSNRGVNHFSTAPGSETSIFKDALASRQVFQKENLRPMVADKINADLSYNFPHKSETIRALMHEIENSLQELNKYSSETQCLSCVREANKVKAEAGPFEVKPIDAVGKAKK